MSTLLFAHNRKDRGDVLPPHLSAALASWFGTPRTNDVAAERSARSYLLDLRSCEGWLACGCRDDDSTVSTPPLMSPRLRDGQVHLWRHGATPHAKSCPFWIDDNVVVAGAPGQRPASSIWLLPQQATNHSNVRADDPGRDAATNRAGDPLCERLAHLLVSTLDRVGYTSVLAADIKTQRGSRARSANNDSYSALERLYDERITDQLVWRDIGCTYLPALHRHLKGLDALSAKFPATHAAQGVYFGIVHEIAPLPLGRSQLQWLSNQRTCVAEVESRVVPLSGSNGAAGPYWVIAHLKRRSGGGPFAIARACSIPCLSRAVLLPVTTDWQRITAECLLSQISYWKKPASFGLDVPLEKPLVNARSEEAGSAVHADFVLWMPNGKRLFISSVPAEEQAVERAARLEKSAILRSLPGAAGLVEHHVADLDTLRFGKLLSAILARNR